jgi:hypothetical protein
MVESLGHSDNENCDFFQLLPLTSTAEQALDEINVKCQTNEGTTVEALGRPPFSCSRNQRLSTIMCFIERWGLTTYLLVPVGDFRLGSRRLASLNAASADELSFSLRRDIPKL